MNIGYWIFDYFIIILEVVGCCVFTGIFTDIRNREAINKYWFVLFAFGASAILLVVNITELFSQVNGIISIIILCIFQYILYRKNILKIILLTFIYGVIVSAIDFTAVQLFGVIFVYETGFLAEVHSLQRCLCVLISKAILFFDIYLIYKYNKVKLDVPPKYIRIVLAFTVFLYSIDYYFINDKDISLNPKIKLFSSIFFVSSIALVLLVFSLMIKMAESHRQKQDISQLELKNKMMLKSSKDTEQAFDLWKKSIHDYKHKIIAMEKWIEEGNLAELKLFIEKEEKLLSKKLFGIKTGNASVDAVINMKQTLAYEEGIIFIANAHMSKDCAISDMDIVCLLGNLVDNAIEACRLQGGKWIEVIIKEKKKMLFLVVKNPFKLPDPDKEINDLFVTTKDDKEFHGIGLASIRSIAQKYDGTFDIREADEEIVSTVMLLNRKAVEI